MTNGIFHVDFRASTGDYGDGLVVVKDGTVNGGEPHYLYQGQVPTVSGSFESKFTVRKWRDGNTNVVGVDNYTLDANGKRGTNLFFRSGRKNKSTPFLFKNAPHR